MKPQWINNIYIGPFWMGTPEQIAQTQDAIDEEIALYEEAVDNAEATQDKMEWLEGEDEIQPGF